VISVKREEPHQKKLTFVGRMDHSSLRVPIVRSLTVCAAQDDKRIR